MPKVEILKREIDAAGLGTHVAAHKGWISDAAMRDWAKSCDVLFGCTDDNQGRLLLNRLAHYYGIPVIDMGLRMRAARAGAEYDMTGRVSVIVPGNTCLICLGVVDPRLAYAEALKRNDLAEFQRRKAEAYVQDGGDPAPAVVTFTTGIACAAVDELIQGLTSYKAMPGMVSNRVRRFERGDDRLTIVQPMPTCPMCGGHTHWGRADCEPFLGVIG